MSKTIVLTQSDGTFGTYMLTNAGEFHGLSGRSVIENFVLANGHWHKRRLELSSEVGNLYYCFFQWLFDGSE